MEKIAILLWGLVMFIDVLFDKWLVWHKFENFGQNQKWTIRIYQLTHCRFCCLFWMTIFIWIFLAYFGFIQWTTFPVVFIVGGLNSIKHKP